MCGIFCVFSKSDLNTTEKLSTTFQKFNLNLSRRGPNHNKIEICHNKDHILLFAASVLWLQGSKLTKQPLIDKDHLLVYNGDIFDRENENDRNLYGDTKLFLDFFKSKKSMKSLFHTNGPFAFICLDKDSSTIYFGRDKYGRRSLLIGKSDDGEIVLTSVARKCTNFTFIELPSLGIFSYNLNNKQFTLNPWICEDSNIIMDKLKRFNVLFNTEIHIQEPIFHKSMTKSFLEPQDNDMSLYNFLKTNPNFNISDVLLSFPKLTDNINTLNNYLLSAVKKRISNQPQYCQNCIREQNICDHSLLGILFSGGVDCAILALLAHKIVDSKRPIDLLNVAFSDKEFNTPDRITGLQTFEELKKLCPDRKWNFVEINVTFEELDKERKCRIADLIYPLNTILDESLGCAIWFASRGKANNYISPCRVLLVGMGADELFGGYSRHRAAFKNEGWLGLHNSLRDDWEKLPYRNLGRDDRVVSDHGRQLRTPYLDEDVVEFIQSLHSWEKTLPTHELQQEVGPKFFLRFLAYQLGLTEAAFLRKRALQFGSRIANSKENAHEISPRL